MRILALMGSPQKGGNTAVIVDWIGEEIRAQGHDFERIDIVDYEVRGCIGCYKCQDVADEPGCVFTEKDDGDKIWRKAIDSDVILMATPLYYWGHTAQLKAFIDRSFALVKNYGTAPRKSLLSGRRIGLVVTCMGPVEDNAEHMKDINKRLAGATQCVDAGTLCIAYTTGPGALGNEQRKAAVEFARKLVEA